MVDCSRDGLFQAMFVRGIPQHMHDGLADYILHGVEPGPFLTAVLEGDLFEALGRADGTNVNALDAYGMFLYNDAPAGCYGSVDKYAAWIKSGGVEPK